MDLKWYKDNTPLIFPLIEELQGTKMVSMISGGDGCFQVDDKNDKLVEFADVLFISLAKRYQRKLHSLMKFIAWKKVSYEGCAQVEATLTYGDKRSWKYDCYRITIEAQKGQTPEEKRNQTDIAIRNLVRLVQVWKRKKLRGELSFHIFWKW